MDYDFDVISKKYLQNPKSQIYYLMFYYRHFRFLDFYASEITNFELIFI